MICVSIARGRHRHVIAEHKHLVEQGAQLVELRLDYIRGPVNIKRLLNDRPSPAVVCCRRPEDGGRYGGSEEDRLLMLRTSVAEGVEYVDLEEDTAKQIPRYGETKRIVSMHDFRKTPENLEEIHARLAACDADIVKIATLANHPHDNIRMLSLVRDAEIPTVGICMGDIGMPTRILGGRFGSPFSYATFHHERTLAPGQLTFSQMKQIYHYDHIDRHTKVYGVIGDPIAHSYSPLIHNAAFDELGLNCVYLPFRVPREDLRQFIEDVPELGVEGLSVTIPHKEAAMELVTKVDNAAKRVGAANTLEFSDEGIVGYNTDYRAAMDSLEGAMGGGRDDGFNPMRGMTAMLLGAGGVAQAIAHGLKRREVNVVVAGRTREKAQHLAEQVEGRAVDWESRHTVACDILVNCTPIGMHPEVDYTPFDKHHLKPNMVVFDTVYNPERTLLVKEARERNCNVVTGVDMFIKQAAMQFKIFTGQDAPSEAMRLALKRATGAAKM